MKTKGNTETFPWQSGYGQITVTDGSPPIKKVEDRTNADLLELVLQLHSRALIYETKEMHDAYMEARFELEKRLK